MFIQGCRPRAQPKFPYGNGDPVIEHAMFLHTGIAVSSLKSRVSTSFRGAYTIPGAAGLSLLPYASRGWNPVRNQF